MIQCEFCGKPVGAMPFIGRDGGVYCVDHKIPESRGKSGQYKDGYYVGMRVIEMPKEES